MIVSIVYYIVSISIAKFNKFNSLSTLDLTLKISFLIVIKYYI